MEFDLLSFFSGLAIAAIPTVAAFAGAAWSQVRIAAKASQTPLDDRLVDFIESVADRIVDAKLSDPEDPYRP